MKTLPVLACSLAGLLATSAFAASKVDYVDVRAAGININDGVVRVQAVNGQYQKTKSNTVSYHTELKGGCEGQWRLGAASVQFGDAGQSGTIFESNNFYSKLISTRGRKSMNYEDANLDVPINKLPVNPVAMCQQYLNQKKQQGVPAMTVLNSEKVFTQKVTLSGVVMCEKPGNNTNHYGIDKMQADLKVICEAGGNGMPSQVKAPKLPITAVPMGGSGGVQVGYNPLVITDIQLLADTLHYRGTCPANQKFTVKFKGGGEGHVKIHLVEKGQKLYTSPPLAYKGSDGWKSYNFSQVIPSNPNEVNKTITRNPAVLLEYKDKDSNTWKVKSDDDSLSWRYTCQPQVRVKTQGTLQVNPTSTAPQPKRATR